jgi:hypothetical protein
MPGLLSYVIAFSWPGSLGRKIDFIYYDLPLLMHDSLSWWLQVVSFQYKIRDNLGVISAPGDVTVTVKPAPVGPVANPDIAAVISGGSYIIEVAGNDQGGTAPYTVNAVTTPDFGNSAVSADGAAVEYIAPADFSGQVSYGALSTGYSYAECNSNCYSYSYVTAQLQLLYSIVTITVTVTVQPYCTEYGQLKSMPVLPEQAHAW